MQERNLERVLFVVGNRRKAALLKESGVPVLFIQARSPPVRPMIIPPMWKRSRICLCRIGELRQDFQIALV